MNGKSLRGINGVLEHLISAPTQNMDSANETVQQAKTPFPSAPIPRRATANGCSAVQGA